MEIPYLALLRHILENGAIKTDRTGTGTKSVFGYQMRHDLSQGFPLLTTKKIHLKSIIYELLWFLKGDTNIAYLKENGVSIWDEWADEDGELGPVYGEQWRKWQIPLVQQKRNKRNKNKTKGNENVIPTQQSFWEMEDIPMPNFTFDTQIRKWETDNGKIDQIKNVITQIKKKPDSRRLIVSAWNPAVIDDMALPPCHALFQFYVAHGKLSCLLYQRSADVFLGVPFNIASYALLTQMVAQVCDLEVGEFIWTGGDTHLYLNHFEQVEEQLSREPRPLPTLRLNPAVKDIFSFQYEDFTLENYNPHPRINAPVAV